MKIANLSRHSEGAHECVVVFGALLAASHSGAGLLGARLYVQLAVQDVYAVASTAFQLPVAEKPTAANVDPVFTPLTYMIRNTQLSHDFPEVSAGTVFLVSCLSVCSHCWAGV